MKFNEKMTVIADNIRSKTGGTEALSLDGMANGINEVYDKGRTDEQNAFWDKFTQNGERNWYAYAFIGFTDECIRPNRKIVPRGCATADNIPSYAYMFHYNSYIKKVEKKYFDFSNINTDKFNISQTTHQLGNRQICHYCTALEEFEDVGMPAGYYYYTWARCGKLHTIELIRSNADTHFESAFSVCSSLKNVRFEGEIGRNLSISYSPLSVESVKDIILHLKDYSGTENAGVYTLTLKDTCKTAMANLGAIPEFNNKTYDAYITDIGWNLA
ncbi:MAG: hypothetical protein IKA17_04450 [Clostridia bacterium]|nr:hypothetical protein [Clostridia bacterium]